MGKPSGENFQGANSMVPLTAGHFPSIPSIESPPWDTPIGPQMGIPPRERHQGNKFLGHPPRNALQGNQQRGPSIAPLLLDILQGTSICRPNQLNPCWGTPTGDYLQATQFRGPLQATTSSVYPRFDPIQGCPQITHFKGKPPGNTLQVNPSRRHQGTPTRVHPSGYHNKRTFSD
jgi:hypothetical protein